MCCVYRPPSANISFWKDFEWSVESVSESNDNIIIVGDLNCDFLKLPKNHICNDILIRYNLQNVISDPTRITVNSQTLIDPIFMSNELKLIESGVLEIDEQISDHRATHISVELNYVFESSYQRQIWLYKNADFEKLNELLLTCNWEELITNALSIDHATINFTNTFMKCVKETIPEKTITIRTKDKPWFDATLRTNIRKRDRLRKKYNKSKRNIDLISYKHQRNYVNNLKKKRAKVDYYDNIETRLLDSNVDNV